jgi:hypothetical protein
MALLWTRGMQIGSGFTPRVRQGRRGRGPVKTTTTTTKARALVTSRNLRKQNQNLQEGLGTSVFGEIVPRASVDATRTQSLHSLPPLEDAL